MMAAGPRMHLFNALEANDGGPADTEKIAGRKLRPAHYRLVAKPIAHGLSGPRARVAFRIVH